MNNRTLLHYHNQLEEMRTNASILFPMLRNKIKEFYRSNGIRIETLLKKINEMQRIYFVIENNQIKFEGEDKDKKPVMKEGKLMEEYSKEYNELMNIEVQINF